MSYNVEIKYHRIKLQMNHDNPDFTEKLELLEYSTLFYSWIGEHSSEDAPYRKSKS